MINKLQIFNENAIKMNSPLKKLIALRSENGYCTDAIDDAKPNNKKGK